MCAMCDELSRVREENRRLEARIMTNEIMANEVQASLNYELNKTISQKLADLLKDLFR